MLVGPASGVRAVLRRRPRDDEGAPPARRGDELRAGDGGHEALGVVGRRVGGVVDRAQLQGHQAALVVADDRKVASGGLPPLGQHVEGGPGVGHEVVDAEADVELELALTRPPLVAAVRHATFTVTRMPPV